MDPQLIRLILRALLQAFGGSELLGGDDNIDKAIGALMVLGGIAWSIYEKRSRRSADAS